MGQICFKAKKKNHNKLPPKALTNPSSSPIAAPAEEPIILHITEENYFDSCIIQEDAVISKVPEGKLFISPWTKRKPLAPCRIQTKMKIILDSDSRIESEDWDSITFRSKENFEKLKVYEERAKGIGKNLKMLKSVKEVYLEINSIKDKSDLEPLKEFRKGVRIKKIHLSFEGPTEYERLIEICEKIKKLIFLRSLIITIRKFKVFRVRRTKMEEDPFEERWPLSQKAMEYLAKWREGYKELEDFKLCLDDCEEFPTNILSKSLSRSRKLKSLSLVGINIFPSGNLKKLKGLKELCLHFSRTSQITSQGFEILCQSFSEVENLESLDLLFENLSTTLDWVIRNLDCGLSHLKRFSNLRLHLGRCLPSAKGISILFIFLEKHPRLHKIFINLKENPDESFKKRFPDGHFYFAQNKYGTNEDLELITGYLNKNRLITSVVFDFSESQKIDETGLEILRETLKGNPRIKEIVFI